MEKLEYLKFLTIIFLFFFQIISIESPQRTNEKKQKTGELPDLLKRYFFVKQSSEKFF